MTRKLALVAGVLFSAVSAGALHAQATTNTQPPASSNAKPPSSKMQHPAPAARQDTTAAKPGYHHAKWTKEQVIQAQQGLTKAGFYKGQANGKFDKQTRNAIKAYQKSNKMPVTGRLSDSLLTRLRSS